MTLAKRFFILESPVFYLKKKIDEKLTSNKFEDLQRSKNTLHNILRRTAATQVGNNTKMATAKEATAETATYGELIKLLYEKYKPSFDKVTFLSGVDNGGELFENMKENKIIGDDIEKDTEASMDIIKMFAEADMDVSDVGWWMLTIGEHTLDVYMCETCGDCDHSRWKWS
jgi:hypothetical protein